MYNGVVALIMCMLEHCHLNRIQTEVVLFVNVEDASDVSPNHIQEQTYIYSSYG